MSHGARERRRAVRLRPTHAKAVCSTRQVGGVYDIQDLSRGGVLLEGRPTVPPGTRVSLRVLLPGVDPMTLAGRVIRSCAGSFADAQLAVRFSSVSPDDEDRFADLIAREWSKVCAPRCVVAASSLQTRMELTRRIGNLGVKVTRASTPIELIHRLEAARGRCVVVFLGTTLGGCSGVEIASFLATAYPSVRRVLVTMTHSSEEVGPPDPLHAVLEAPWSDDAIREELRDARHSASRSPLGAANEA